MIKRHGHRYITAESDHLDLYHRTTPEAAASIMKQKRMDSKERGDVFFSTHRSGENAGGYGSAVVHVRVPEHLAELDDEFPDGEQHYRVRNRDLQPHHFVAVRRTGAEQLDEHQERALGRLAQLPHEFIQGPEAHKLYAEHGITLHGEDPWEAGEIDDDNHITKDTGRSRVHRANAPLHTSQDYLKRSTLEHFVRHPEDAGNHDERPSTWEHEGKHWINGGHHRILADRMTHAQGMEVSDRTKRTVEASLGRTIHVAAEYPHHDSVANITRNFGFADGDSWHDVRSNYVAGHPVHQKMREDIRQNGIHHPIPIDYDQNPPKVLDGHTRLWHAEGLGMKRVPVRHVTEDDHRWEEAEPDQGHYEARPEQIDHSARHEQWTRNAATGQGHELGDFGPHPKSNSISTASCQRCGASAHVTSFGKVGGPATEEPCARQHTAAGGDAHRLSFTDPDEQDTGGSKWPNEGFIHANHPDHGRVGHVRYLRGNRVNSPIKIQMLTVNEEHQRKGYGSALMDQLQTAFPKARIDHGDRTNNGAAWWDAYGKGKANGRGRTSGLASNGTLHARASQYPEGIRMMAPEHYRKLRMGDFPGKSLAQVRQHLQGASPGYYAQLHDDIAGKGVQAPVLLRGGRTVMDGHHRLAIGDELDQHVPVGDYDNEEHYNAAFDAPGGKEWARRRSEGDGNRLGMRAHGVTTGWDHNDEDPSTWHPDYKRWAGEKPHATAVSQAQEKVRRDYPTMTMEMGTEDDATATMQHMLHRGGHPLADQGSTHTHSNPEWGQSQAYLSEGRFPSVAIHHDRWDYGTLAHEVAHHLHQHHDLGGSKPADDAEAHGPGFVKHYQSVVEGMMGRRGGEASQLLGDTYHQALDRVGQHRQAAFTPDKRIFGPTHGLDHRLWEGDHLRHDVSSWIMRILNAFWFSRYGTNWEVWARVYFAGSEASEWTSEALEGNNDFDVLIGVNYDLFREHVPVPSLRELGDEEITAHLNAELREGLIPMTDPSTIEVDGQSTGPWSVTWYVNQDSWDIRDIKPYAAYNVSADTWAVRPPHLPDWSVKSFPKAFVAEARAVEAYVKAVLALPEPMRSQQADALWRHLHSDRSRAFSPQGEGWWDPGNALEKWLDQAGVWEQLAEAHFAAVADPSKLLAPSGWSNTPMPL